LRIAREDLQEKTTMADSTSLSDRRRAPSSRPLRGRSVRLATVAVALVLVVALAIALLLSWLPGDAPDLYSRWTDDVLDSVRIVDPGTASATSRALAVWPAH
jgi:hypothetical protein